MQEQTKVLIIHSIIGDGALIMSDDNYYGIVTKFNERKIIPKSSVISKQIVIVENK